MLADKARRIRLLFALSVVLLATSVHVYTQSNAIEIIEPTSFVGWFNSIGELPTITLTYENKTASQATILCFWLARDIPVAGHAILNVEMETTGSKRCNPSSFGNILEGDGSVKSIICEPKAGPGGSCQHIAEDTVLNIFGIDLTVPTIVIHSPAEGADYQQNEEVLADYNAYDDLSGVDSVSGSTASGELIDTGTTGLKLFEVEAFDLAGNRQFETVTYSVIGDTEEASSGEDESAESEEEAPSQTTPWNEKSDPDCQGRTEASIILGEMNTEECIYMRPDGGSFDTEVVYVGDPPVEARRTGGGRSLDSADGNQASDTFVLFNVDDNFLFKGEPTSRINIEVEYFDDGIEYFGVQYDAPPPSGAYTWAETRVKQSNSKEWKTAIFAISDAYFANETREGDFWIVDSPNGPVTIRKITIRRAL